MHVFACHGLEEEARDLAIFAVLRDGERQSHVLHYGTTGNGCALLWVFFVFALSDPGRDRMTASRDPPVHFLNEMLQALLCKRRISYISGSAKKARDKLDRSPLQPV